MDDSDALTEEELIEFRKTIKRNWSLATIKECFHHDKSQCKGKIKKAHSLQSNGRLSMITAEVRGNQMLYTFTSHIPSRTRTYADLDPIGKAEASTFFGFCDHHDTVLFSPIENFEFDGSAKHLFLHSYRSYAHSYHRKMEEYRIWTENIDFIKTVPKDYYTEYRRGLDLAMKDALHYKPRLDEALEAEHYDFFEYLVFEKEGLFPFAVSSQLNPITSYKGKPMNMHIDPEVPFSQPLLTLLPDKGKTIVIVAAFPEDKDSITLLDELNELPSLKLEKAVSSLAIACCENTFFSPLVWNSLSKIEKRRFLDEYEFTTMPQFPRDRFFQSSFNFFDSRFELTRMKKNGVR